MQNNLPQITELKLCRTLPKRYCKFLQDVIGCFIFLKPKTVARNHLYPYVSASIFENMFNFSLSDRTWELRQVHMIRVVKDAMLGRKHEAVIMENEINSQNYFQFDVGASVHHQIC